MSGYRRRQFLDCSPQLAERFRIPDIFPLSRGNPIGLHMYIRRCMRRGYVPIFLVSNQRAGIANASNYESTRKIARIIIFGWRDNIISPSAKPSLEMLLKIIWQV